MARKNGFISLGLLYRFPIPASRKHPCYVTGNPAVLIQAES
jgi:hypothetical protein